MNKSTARIQQELVNQWDGVKELLGRIAPSAIVSPADGWSIFHPMPSDTDGYAAFDIQPVVFNLPERADDQRLNLFVVVRGRLKLDRQTAEGDATLATHGFSTEVGYFRKKADKLIHVYGSHYDFSINEIGHPVFHAQMKSFNDFSKYVINEFQFVGAMEDSVQGILKTVRIPTAQMDFFSLILQLIADHLLYYRSDDEQKAAFASLVINNKFLQGAAFQFSRLTTQSASNCYRANHWYP